MTGSGHSFRASALIATALALASAMTTASAANPMAEKTEAVDAAVSRHQQAERETQKRQPTDDLVRAYFEQFGEYAERDLSELSGSELNELYLATLSAAFQTYNPHILDVLIRATDVLTDRDQRVDVPGRHSGYDNPAQTTYDTLVNARALDRAHQFAARHGDTIEQLATEIPAAPANRKDAGPTVLAVETENERPAFRPETVAIDSGQWIIATVSTGCPFSRRAMNYLEAHPELGNRFKGRTVWLTSQLETERLNDVADWNRESEISDLVIAWRDDQWPQEIQPTLTPVFYFMDDGEILHRVVGWQSDEQAKELVKGFELLERNSEPSTDDRTGDRQAGL